MPRHRQFLTILTSKSLSRAGVVQILSMSTSKSAPACQFLTILTSKSLSRAGVVQILSRSTSKSAPNPRRFNDFDFQIALARRRGANFVDILDSRSFATPVFRTYLCELSKRQNYGKTQHFAQFLPAKTFLLSNIDAARATANFQYSRKLELLNFLWILTLYKNNQSC